MMLDNLMNEIQAEDEDDLAHHMGDEDDSDLEDEDDVNQLANV